VGENFLTPFSVVQVLPRDPPKVQENKIDKADLMKILAKDGGDKDEIDQADRGAGIGFGAVQRHSEDLIDSVKKKDAESKYNPETNVEEFRSSRHYDASAAMKPRGSESSRNYTETDDSELPRRDQEKKHRDKDKHKQKEKHKSKDKDKHRHKDKERKQKDSARKRSRSRSRERSRSPRDRARLVHHDAHGRRHDSDRRDRHEHDRERRHRESDRGYSRPDDRGRQRSRSRSPPSPKRRRLDTPSPPRRSISPATSRRE
jgi:hypothetical protein